MAQLLVRLSRLPLAARGRGTSPANRARHTPPRPPAVPARPAPSGSSNSVRILRASSSSPASCSAPRPPSRTCCKYQMLKSLSFCFGFPKGTIKRQPRYFHSINCAVNYQYIITLIGQLVGCTDEFGIKIDGLVTLE